jgi:alkylated DNA nucleotide flippase Atl1
MVAARETTLQELLEGSKQYQVPLYQRTYSWSNAQLARLWDDIVKLAEDRVSAPEVTHFIGSLVLAPSPSNGPAGVQEFLVVDGQQRLTTLSILLCAIRDHRAQFEDSEHRDRINQQYLLNKWRPEGQRPKLLPTQADRAAYIACLDSTPKAGGSDPVGSAYRFFAAQLTGGDDPDDPADIERIEDAVISGLALVSVTAQLGDNAHRIFESLNNTGLRLTQGDLLRNYIFMRLPTRAEAVYPALWLPLQELLSSSDLELLFWLDLVQRDARMKQTDTYAGQQARLDRLATEEQIEEELRRFTRLGALLKVILDPARESDRAVRFRLQRLRAWGTTTVYPLLLHLLDRRDQGEASSEQIAAAMLYVESFFVRRLLIGRATANLNRILLSVVTEMSKDLPVDEAVRTYLSTGRKHYATDADVHAAVTTIPYYLNGRPTQRAMVLRWLEESYGNKEPVDLSTLTIEHVLPQTPTKNWQEVLTEDLEPSEDFRQVHESLVHTLGNLTLTGYNSTLSNSPFDVKRDKLSTSGLSMNQEIAEEERWSRPQIQKRATALADRVAQIWPGPLRVDATSEADIGWDLMNKALAELPAGSWTTYGDLAALIGSHAVSVGMRLATKAAPNAHRVLQVEGNVSPGFRWLDRNRTDDPQQVLLEEGVLFDDRGRADANQRMSMEELAELVGISSKEVGSELADPPAGQDPALRDGFLKQLRENQPAGTVHGVLALLDAWVLMGGQVDYGTAGETSCFLMARESTQVEQSIWPLAIYPSGRCEVVFQHLAHRKPFDDLPLREEMRQRFNKVPGVALAGAKLQLRPSFDVSVVADPGARSVLLEQLGWFLDNAQMSKLSRGLIDDLRQSEPNSMAEQVTDNG